MSYYRGIITAALVISAKMTKKKPTWMKGIFNVAVFFPYFTVMKYWFQFMARLLPDIIEAISSIIPQILPLYSCLTPGTTSSCLHLRSGGLFSPFKIKYSICKSRIIGRLFQYWRIKAEEIWSEINNGFVQT